MKLFQEIIGHIPENKNIILALSGGPDSIFLGEKLVETYRNTSTNIVAAHFNHNLRVDSGSDEEFCKKWAEKNGCIFERGEWKNPIDSEEKARNARYEFLEKIREKYNATAIFVGTHNDDNAETILFQFLRGSGAKGLGGIATKNDSRKIFRPLLDIQKKEILKYLTEKNISYCVDSTNLESEYSRNFLRNKVIPLLNEKFPFWKKNITRQSEVFSEMNDFLEKEAQKFLNFPFSEGGLSRKKFSSLHLAVQNYVLRDIFSPAALDFEQVKNIREFIHIGKSGKKMELKKKRILLSHEFFFIEEHGER